MIIPSGYSFAVAQAGFKKKDRYDLGLILSDRPATAAGVFTTNRFQAAPVVVSKQSLKDSGGRARAIVVNSGQANACTGDEGEANCRRTLEMISGITGAEASEVLSASTGVIGVQLKMDLWREALPQLEANLGQSGPLDVAKAIMTTDTFPKVAWGEIEGEGKTAKVFGMAKGAGMICPDMATMLGFIVTDAEVDPARLDRCLRKAVNASFNLVTVDGDTSTNDCAFLMANGAGGMTIGDAEEEAFVEALVEVCQALAYMIVQDAEGGTKVARIVVKGAEDDRQAEMAARAVGHSPLVKTALFGQDPNWGRIVAALGRSGAHFEPNDVVVSIGSIEVFRNGQPSCPDVDALLAPVMRRQDVLIDVTLGSGDGEYLLLASDLSRDYVSINADYRS